MNVEAELSRTKFSPLSRVFLDSVAAAKNDNQFWEECVK